MAFPDGSLSVPRSPHLPGAGSLQNCVYTCAFLSPFCFLPCFRRDLKALPHQEQLQLLTRVFSPLH